MLIETATTTDIPALSELLSELFSQELEFAPDNTAQSSGLLKIIESPDIGIILLARRNGQVVGMLTMLFTISTALGAPVVLLEDMIVTAACRGERVGSQLLSEAISLASRRGCKRITVLTDGVNLAAQQFYATQGFVASSMKPMRLFLR